MPFCVSWLSLPGRGERRRRRRRRRGREKSCTALPGAGGGASPPLPLAHRRWETPPRCFSPAEPAPKTWGVDPHPVLPPRLENRRRDSAACALGARRNAFLSRSPSTVGRVVWGVCRGGGFQSFGWIPWGGVRGNGTTPIPARGARKDEALLESFARSVAFTPSDSGVARKAEEGGLRDRGWE